MLPAAAAGTSPSEVIHCGDAAARDQAAPQRSSIPGEPAASSSTATAGAAVPTVPVECQFTALGSFMFRGSHGIVEAVSLSPMVLLGRSLQPSVPAGVPRAQCVVRRVDVVGRATVLLPSALEGWSTD
jgi:hypothetical protein